MASSQGAVAAVPAGKESMRRIPNPDEAEQLRKLVQYVYQNDSEGDRNEALDAAMADVDLAMECYRAIVLERGLIPVIDDDRRTCRQCANLSYSSSCKVACPGGALSAQKGYRAGALWLENPHRCEAFHEKGKP
ncbi:hypothetical protein [Propionivibrio sp.]|uniref:hypothetical protein n=1 Tax=Propionivibrio sp. TaxID=2212460 RepID=UPI003BEFBD8E